MINIEQQLWGMNPEGEAIVIYKITNDCGAEVQLTNLGAAVVAIKVPDREGKIENVLLGSATAEEAMRDTLHLGKIVGRYAGLIGSARFSLGEQEYHLEPNASRHHVDGGAKALQHRLWESRVEYNRIVMELESPDGESGYPGSLYVQVIYDFDDDCSFEITVRAAADHDTPLNIASNLCFNLDGAESGSVLDHQLKVNATTYVEQNSRHLPSGELLPVESTPLDFTHFKPLGRDIDSSEARIDDFGGYSHTLPVDGYRKNILSEVATLLSERSGRRLTILSSQPALHLDTGNDLSVGSHLRTGGGYKDWGGVFLLCRNLSDAPNHPNFPNSIVEAGELYIQKTVYNFSIL